MKWPRVSIDTPDGVKEGIAPLVISASRSTDIPAFHADWLMNRVRAGYVRWVNPFNRKSQFVSLLRARAYVFWSKNPAPLIPHLAELDLRGLGYYFQFTLNDYAAEGYEPRLPELQARIETFKILSERIGPELVAWRFDPLLLSDRIDLETLLARVETVGEQLEGATRRLVISFVDIDCYRKVVNNLRRTGADLREFTPAEMNQLATRLVELANDWGMKVQTCSEKVDLSDRGIAKSRCIDPELLRQASRNDEEITDLFGRGQLGLFTSEDKSNQLKDKGQRADCGCVVSKDIGRYDTCGHLCVHCYANTSEQTVQRNLARADPDADSILPESATQP